MAREKAEPKNKKASAKNTALDHTRRKIAYIILFEHLAIFFTYTVFIGFNIITPADLKDVGSFFFCVSILPAIILSFYFSNDNGFVKDLINKL